MLQNIYSLEFQIIFLKFCIDYFYVLGFVGIFWPCSRSVIYLIIRIVGFIVVCYEACRNVAEREPFRGSKINLPFLVFLIKLELTRVKCNPMQFTSC